MNEEKQAIIDREWWYEVGLCVHPEAVCFEWTGRHDGPTW